MNRFSGPAVLAAAALIPGACDTNADNVPAPTPAPAGETRAASTETSPRIGALQTVKSFYTSLQRGAVEQAARLVIASPTAGRGELMNELKSFSHALRTRWIEIGVHESKESGPCALVVVSVKFHNGKKFETHLREEILLRRDGAWFVVPEAFRADPAVKTAMAKHGKPLLTAFHRQLPALREKYK